MKVAVLMLLISYACRPHHGPELAKAENSNPVGKPATELLAFEKDVQPILECHCTPCHFKGGKMYERMPFDQSKTLVDFQEAILRRMKNEEEATKIRAFLVQMK